MFERKKLIVSHAPFWHIGNRVTGRSYQTMLAAAPALLGGLVYYGAPVVAVVGLSVASAMLWELLLNKVMKKPPSIGDGTGTRCSGQGSSPPTTRTPTLSSTTDASPPCGRGEPLRPSWQLVNDDRPTPRHPWWRQTRRC